MALIDKLSAIGDAIRAKTGKEELLTLDEMPIEIANINSGEDADLLSLDEFVGGGLTEVDLPTATKLKQYLFYGDTTVKNVNIPKATSIGNCAFQYCYGLVSISLSSELTSIGSQVFTGCSKLALTSLPPKITTIGNSAFGNCKQLALTSLPSGLKTIGDSSFYGCTNLKSITFQGKPDSIKNNSFSSCSNLTTINVPWAEDEVANAPWGATNATINYNYTGE